MKAEDVKIGMKVKIVSNPPAYCYGHNQVGTVLTITVLPDTLGRRGAVGFKGEHGGEHGYINCMYIEPHTFTKADLKTGMRVIYRKGACRAVVEEYLTDRFSSVGPRLADYDETMYSGYSGAIDIMEVYAAPASCEDFFNLDVRGELLFKREEAPVKTEKQKQAEELMAKAEELKAQLEALVKQATDLAGEGYE